MVGEVERFRAMRLSLTENCPNHCHSPFIHFRTKLYTLNKDTGVYKLK
jgi:hypothetical protein